MSSSQQPFSAFVERRPGDKSTNALQYAQDYLEGSDDDDNDDKVSDDSYAVSLIIFIYGSMRQHIAHCRPICTLD